MKKTVKMIGRMAIATLVLGAAAATSAQAAIVYNVNETITGPLNGVIGNPTQTNSVVGSITTDGTIGFLHAANFISYDLNLIDTLNASNNYHLTSSNALISIDFGSVLNATATGLFFNFSNTGAIAFQAQSPGAFSGYHYWCLSQNYFGCLDGNSIAPNNVYAGNSGDDLVTAAAGTQGQIGNSPLDQTPPSSVPEPATWAMLMIGFSAVGFAMRGSRRARAGITNA